MADYYISSTKHSIQTRQTKKNGTVYDVVFRIIEKDGTEKQKKLSGFANKTKAKQAYTSFVTERCELVKNNPLKKKKPDKEKLLVGDLYLCYITAMRGQIKDATIYGKKYAFEKYILPEFGNVDVRDVTKDKLYLWQDGLWQKINPRTKTYFSDGRLCGIRDAFNAFLNWCEERYDVENNLQRVSRPKKRNQKKIMQIWTREEFERFISVVDNPTYRLLYTLLFFTGRREAEILALTWDDVKENSIVFNKNLSRSRIYATGSIWIDSTTKANKSAEIPMCDPVRAALADYPREGKRVIGGDKDMSPVTIFVKFQDYAKKAGVKQIRVHDLRHSYVSMLIHLGANVAVVADLISDTQQQVMKTYSHLYNEDKLDIISRIK